MATAYTELNGIHNPSTGTSPPAAWGDGVRDNLDALYNPPLGHVYKVAVQSVADATDTVLLFDTEYEDTDGLHSTVTNTGRFTAAKAGWYLALINVSWAASTVGRRRIALRKNGSATWYQNQDAPATSVTTNQNVVQLFDLAVNDYVDAIGYQNTGGALDATAQFQIVRVSGT